MYPILFSIRIYQVNVKYVPRWQDKCYKQLLFVWSIYLLDLIYPLPIVIDLYPAGLFRFRYPEFSILRFPDRHSRFRFYFCIKIWNQKWLEDFSPDHFHPLTQRTASLDENWDPYTRKWSALNRTKRRYKNHNKPPMLKHFDGRSAWKGQCP
jgi:hypothetical protein